MFYIDANILRKKEIILLRILPAVIVLFAFIGATIISWNTATRNVKTEQVKILDQQNMLIAEQIKQRMSSYENILRGGIGVFRTNQTVSKDQWQKYIESYDLISRYPGIQAVGYAVALNSQNKTQFETTVRSQGTPNFTIFPEGDRPTYVSILYAEPQTDQNQRAVGFDMYSEPTRQEAMNLASKTAQPIVSDVVTLIVDIKDNINQPGFIMYHSNYSALGSTANEQKSDIVGYVFAAFRANDFFTQTLTNKISNYEFQVKNTKYDVEQDLYQTKDYISTSNLPGVQKKETTILIGGKTWTVFGLTAPNVVANDIRERPTSTLFGGILFSFAMAGFLYMFLGSRARALSKKEQLGIQSAKDELLALASHQLRTPATGVKQYIGMLREGYAGEVSDVQMNLLEKAYDSNERQLGTINEMLFVARADAGTLNTKYKLIDLSTLISSIIEEQGSTIFLRKQKISLKLPKRHIFLNGDIQYLRMAIENIVSNATKYTPASGRITIILKQDVHDVTLTISDTGVGVEANDYHLLFKKFSRIPNELTDQVVGSGIGLYLAKKIIETHKGSIDFVSSVGKGSVVTIILPKIKPIKNI